MINYFFTCRSLTYAQRTAKILKKYGITGSVVRTPQELSNQGCGYSVKIREKFFQEALNILNKVDIPPLKIYISLTDGTYREVSR